MVIKMNILSDLVLPAFYSFIASIAFGIQFNIRFRHLIAAAVGGIVSQVILSAAELGGNSAFACYFFSACAISAYSEFLAKRLHVPVNMYLVIAIIPLVPGKMIYQAMITLVNGDTQGFAQECASTFGVAGAIALGVFAVSSAVRVFRVIINKKGI